MSPIPSTYTPEHTTKVEALRPLSEDEVTQEFYSNRPSRIKIKAIEQEGSFDRGAAATTIKSIMEKEKWNNVDPLPFNLVIGTDMKVKGIIFEPDLRNDGDNNLATQATVLIISNKAAYRFVTPMEQFGTSAENQIPKGKFLLEKAKEALENEDNPEHVNGALLTKVPGHESQKTIALIEKVLDVTAVEGREEEKLQAIEEDFTF